jgi:hypothetical protein
MSTKMITKFGLLAVAVCIMLVFAVGCKKKDQGPAAEKAVSSAESTTSSAVKDANAIKDSNAIKDINAPVKDPNAVAETKEALPEQTMCPVMEGPINKDIFTEYKGRKIYFCCPACIEAFTKDPEKYIGKVK